MIDRDRCRHSDVTVRGEVPGFVKEGLLRTHLSRMFSFIQNERQGLGDDPIFCYITQMVSGTQHHSSIAHLHTNSFPHYRKEVYVL